MMSRPPNVPYLDWVRSIRETGDYELIQIKLSDVRDNGDPARLALLADRSELTTKYEKAREILLS